MATITSTITRPKKTGAARRRDGHPDARHRHAVAPRQSEERDRRLSGAAFEAIVISENGSILNVNERFAEMFGCDRTEVVGMRQVDFAAPRSRHLVSRNIAAQREISYQFLALRRDGTTFPVEACARPVPYDECLARVTAIREITERKEAVEPVPQARQELQGKVEWQMLRRNSYGLTFRELTVLYLVSAGLPDKGIGMELGISPLTAQKHISNILTKMAASCRTEAGVRAVREGLLD